MPSLAPQATNQPKQHRTAFVSFPLNSWAHSNSSCLSNLPPPRTSHSAFLLPFRPSFIPSIFDYRYTISLYRPLSSSFVSCPVLYRPVLTHPIPSHFISLIIPSHPHPHPHSRPVPLRTQPSPTCTYSPDAFIHPSISTHSQHSSLSSQTFHSNCLNECSTSCHPFPSLPTASHPVPCHSITSVMSGREKKKKRGGGGIDVSTAQSAFPNSDLSRVELVLSEGKDKGRKEARPCLLDPRNAQEPKRDQRAHSSRNLKVDAGWVRTGGQAEGRGDNSDL